MTAEKDFQQQVIDAERPARSDKGWATPIQGYPGWPDLVLLRRPRLIFAELKSGRGKVTSEQEDWLTELGTIADIEVYVWRPADWPLIVRVLTTKESWRSASRTGPSPCRGQTGMRS